MSVNCARHSDHIYERVCLDPSCRIEPAMCWECILEDQEHLKAHKNYIVKWDQVGSRLESDWKHNQLLKNQDDSSTKQNYLKFLDLSQQYTTFYQQHIEMRKQLCSESINTILNQFQQLCSQLQTQLITSFDDKLNTFLQQLTFLKSNIEIRYGLGDMPDSDQIQQSIINLESNNCNSYISQLKTKLLPQIELEQNVAFLDTMKDFENQLEGFQHDDTDIYDNLTKQVYDQCKVVTDEIAYSIYNHDHLLNRNKIAQSKCDSLQTLTEPSYMENSKRSVPSSSSCSINHIQDIQTQHKRGINCLEVISPICIATGSKDKTIILNRLDRSDLSVTFKGHTDQITALLLFNEQMLISGGGNLDPNLIVWSLNTQRQVQKLKGHQSGITTLKNLNDNVTIISGSYDNTAKIWNIQKGECITTLTKHSAMVSCVCKNGNYLMTGSWDKSIGIWKLQYHGKVVIGCIFMKQVQNDGPILCIENINDDNIIFGGTSNKLYICEFKSGRIERSINGSQFGICELLVNGWILGLGGSDSTLRLWQDYEEKEIKKEYERIQINNYNTSRKLIQLEDGVFGVVNHSDKQKSFSLFEIK